MDWGVTLHALAGAAVGAAFGFGFAFFGRRRERRQHPGKVLSRHQRLEALAWPIGFAVGGALAVGIGLGFYISG